MNDLTAAFRSYMMKQDVRYGEDEYKAVFTESVKVAELVSRETTGKLDAAVMARVLAQQFQFEVREELVVMLYKAKFVGVTSDETGINTKPTNKYK